MTKHSKPGVPPGFVVAIIVLHSLLSLTGAGWCDQLPSQDGLPVELVIPDDKPLSEQLIVYRALADDAKEYNPRPGLLGGCTQMFGGGEQTRQITVPLLAQHVTELLGQTVRVEGMYETRGEAAVLLSEGAEVRVELAGGVVPVGFDTAGGTVDGWPVTVTGTVEEQDDVATVRAQLLVPSESILKVRIGRVLELQGDHEGAVKAYEAVANDGTLAKMPLGAFARIRAGEIAFNELRDEKLARKHYSAAWQPYTVTDGEGKSVYWTWEPVAGGGWETIEAREAITGPLQHLNSQLIGYKIVDFFVQLAGGSHALGIILMAVIVRVAIFPLTKKQLESSRRMQVIQPQIKALQKRLGDDKQKFQEEFWKLCKENNCNPLGGCLPLLVQMPILIFLYRGIRDYIVEFDQVSFLWVPNLSQPDIVLLIAYTVSMVFFQKMSAMTQPAMDPQQQQQQKMMAYMMPIMFFFLFQSFPAAFILYWLGSNLIYLAEHWFFLRKRDDAPSVEPAAEVGGTPPEKKSGFASKMLEAINPQASKPEESPSSYHETQKQDKGGKSGKRK